MAENQRPSVRIDDRAYPLANERGETVDQNLLQFALSQGLNLPYFCWHPALGSVGACRQCAVKQYANDEDEEGRIVMACMVPVQDGMRVSIEDEETKAFRAQGHRVADDEPPARLSGL